MILLLVLRVADKKGSKIFKCTKKWKVLRSFKLTYAILIIATFIPLHKTRNIFIVKLKICR
jgi:hypothetical protein